MSKPNNARTWGRRDGALRMTPQYPLVHEFQWEPDPQGDYRLKAECLDGMWFDYTYDAATGVLLARKVRDLP